ncbi:MAG TPA: TAXI family TRAP transporter solute-binding subunit [Candidatus Binatia bacterium]|jgi:TRAP-type uncharacterized transport system substrate-binding protein
MEGFETRPVLRGTAAAIAVLAILWLALWYFIPAPPSTITIAAGLKGGSFEYIAQRYRKRLARHHVKLNIRFTDGSLDSLKLLLDPKSGVDAAFSLGGVTNNTESPGLVSLGRINYSPIWIFYRSSEPIEHLSQLKGKRVSTSSATRRIVTDILAAYGVTPQNSTFLLFRGPAAGNALLGGEADVISFSQEVTNPNVQPLLRNSAIRAMNVAQAEALTQLFPSLQHVVLSQGVIDLAKNIPPADVNLIALTNVVVARADLHPEMIYLLAQTMKEEHSQGGVLHRSGEFPTQTDPEFPMAQEAVDYYKNGPSFLERYLPFWMINYTKRVIAVLLATFAVIVPLFTYAPRLYAWLSHAYLNRLYRRLRAVQIEMDSELSAAQVKALQTDLKDINRAAHTLSMRRSDAFIDLVTHIRATHAELALRAAAHRK